MSVSPRPWYVSVQGYLWSKPRNSAIWSDEDHQYIADCVNALHAAGITRPERLASLIQKVAEFESELDNPVPDLGYRLKIRREMLAALSACRGSDDA